MILWTAPKVAVLAVWEPICPEMEVLAIPTMLIAALGQSDVKRVIAFFSQKPVFGDAGMVTAMGANVCDCDVRICCGLFSQWQLFQLYFLVYHGWTDRRCFG
jgi:hypothetical protein